MSDLHPVYPFGIATRGTTATAALGTPKPKQPRGRPQGNGALGPITPVPGLGDFNKPRPAGRKASKTKF